MFDPNLFDIGCVISRVFEVIIEGLESLPRLNDKFHVAEVDFKSYSQIIAEDAQCITMQSSINKGKKYFLYFVKKYL